MPIDIELWSRPPHLSSSAMTRLDR